MAHTQGTDTYVGSTQLLPVGHIATPRPAINLAQVKTRLYAYLVGVAVGGPGE